MSVIKTRGCQRCGKEIPADRLEILPETRMCRECSTAVGGEFSLSTTPENLSKAGSLKKNYGSFTIQKTRKPMPPRGT